MNNNPNIEKVIHFLHDHNNWKFERYSSNNHEVWFYTEFNNEEKILKHKTLILNTHLKKGAKPSNDVFRDISLIMDININELKQRIMTYK